VRATAERAMSRCAVSNPFSMTDQQRAEHNKLFNSASAIITNEIPLHDRPPLPRRLAVLHRNHERND
jgi:hypothetical protein